VADPSFLFRIADENERHVEVYVFAGTNVGARGRAGTLKLGVDEWRVLREILVAGAAAEEADLGVTRFVPRDGGGWTDVPDR
jgi:hypothetical protein